MNKSGIIPAGHRVLVQPEEALKAKEGVIEIPDHIKDRHGMSQTAGRLIEVGPTAWQADWAGNKPWAEAGDRIMFAKFGGIQIRGDDGATYRLLNDEDIIAVISEELDISKE